MGAAVSALPLSALHAQDKQPIRIGVIYDWSGPFAAGGSRPAAIGTEIAFDLITSRAA